jgi:hypothetical protein
MIIMVRNWITINNENNIIPKERIFARAARSILEQIATVGKKIRKRV